MYLLMGPHKSYRILKLYRIQLYRMHKGSSIHYSSGIYKLKDTESYKHVRVVRYSYRIHKL